MTVSLSRNFFSNARGSTFLDGGGVTWSINKSTNAITATVGSAGTATTASNLAAGANGSIPYQTGPGTTTFLSVGTNGYLLTVAGGVPAWEVVPTWNQNTSGSSASCTGNAASATVAGGLSATLSIGSGGTGNTTAAAAYNALSPMTTTGDMEYDSSNGVAARLAIGSAGNVMAVVGGVPAWTNAIAPTWTGLHTFAPASGTPATFKPAGGTLAQQNTGASSDAVRIGLTDGNTGVRAWQIRVGGSAVGAFDIFDATGGASRISVSTAGGVSLTGALGVNGAAPPAQVTGFGTPVGAAVVASYNSGTSTALQDKQTIAQILTVLKAAGLIGN